MSRGSAIHEAYAARIEAERLQQTAHGGCLWCPDLRWEGTLEHTRAAALAHRLEHHPEIVIKRRTPRKRPMQTLVTHKSLEENIANARQQGASSGHDDE